MCTTCFCGSIGDTVQEVLWEGTTPLWIKMIDTFENITPCNFVDGNE